MITVDNRSLFLLQHWTIRYLIFREQSHEGGELQMCGRVLHKGHRSGPKKRRVLLQQVFTTTARFHQCPCFFLHLLCFLYSSRQETGVINRLWCHVDMLFFNRTKQLAGESTLSHVHRDTTNPSEGPGSKLSSSALFYPQKSLCLEGSICCKYRQSTSIFCFSHHF